MLGRLVKVTPSSKVVGDLALHLVGAGRGGRGLRGRPGRVRRARLGDRLPARRAGRPARRLAGAVPHPGAGGPPAGEASRRADRRGPARACATDRRGHAEPAAVPRPDQGVRARTARPTATRRCCPRRTSSTAWSRTIEHTVELEPGVTLLIELEAISEPDERGFRTVLTTLNGQLRPVSVRDRVGRHRRQGRGEGRPRQRPEPRRRPVRRRRDAAGRRGRPGGAGPDGRHHRGDEDGGVDHRPARRARSARLAIGKVQQVEGGDLLLELE